MGAWKPYAVIALVCLAPRGVAAHRLDEYLQASRIGIERDRITVEIDLTPGASVADGVFSSIDADLDGRISAPEAERYARRVLGDLGLECDGAPQMLALVGREFPGLAAMREGLGTIRLTATAAVPASPGPHHIVFHNRHRSDISVYLANALAPRESSITIASQQRDYFQRELRIDYRSTAARQPWRTGASVILAALVTAFIVRRTRGAEQFKDFEM